MLLIAGETIRSNRSLSDVAREMSFTLSYFKSQSTFEQLMAGQSRRIVLLGESDVTESILATLKTALGQAPFGLIVASDRATLRTAKQANLVETLTAFENVEWIGKRFDFDRLSRSARSCRRRMLRISQQEIKNAFKNDEFVLRYQPKVERKAGMEWQTKEAESLVRWHHPVNGLMGPLEFLPEIEAFDLMRQLSEFVLQESAAQLIAWREQGIHLNSCINLASSQLVDPTIADVYANIVSDAGLKCSNFSFEVIEQDLSKPKAPHLQTLAALRERGFRICLDDFRVVAASLSTFEKLPFDEIKIHSSALRRAQEDRVAQSVLAAVTGLAHSLGMSVCAEGVEDLATFEFLRTIRCDKMQGFLISEAVLPDIVRRTYSAKDPSKDEVA